LIGRGVSFFIFPDRIIRVEKSLLSRMKQTKFWHISVVALAAMYAAPLSGADTKAAATNAPAAKVQATNQWDASIAAGLTITRGNSETFLSTLTFKAVRKWTNNEVLLGAAGTYGESTTEVTEEKADGTKVKRDESNATTANAAAYAQFNHSFTDRIYGGGRVDFVHDAIADLSYRITVSPLVGYYAIKNPQAKLSFEFGPSGVFEKKEATNSCQYAALRLGDRFEYKFTPKSKVWQSFDVIPQVDRFSNYLLVAEIGGEAAFTQQFSLRAVLQDTYDNEPAEGRKKNDLKLITSLVYKF
jgi:putative salt-induced outer membrane protein YdiY